MAARSEDKMGSAKDSGKVLVQIFILDLKRLYFSTIKKYKCKIKK